MGIKLKVANRWIGENKIFHNFYLLFILLISAMLSGCVKAESPNIPGQDIGDVVAADEDALINRIFRIDIINMTVDLHYKPDEELISGDSIIEFKMRPGEKYPAIHFDISESDTIERITLNGEELDFYNRSDVRMISFDETTQEGIEIVRECDNEKKNVLRIIYNIAHSDRFRSFYSNVNDIYGIGNEVVFPTINSPVDLSRHRITFSVDSERIYTFMGSGQVMDLSNAMGQKWLIDTERDVASYTVMWMMIPAEDVDFSERVINGTDVRIMTYKDSVSINNAFEILEAWLPELNNNLGNFPMKRGIDIFLTGRGGGMEYFGATITSLYALKHEVFHMYFGCSVVAKTYRDSWWDEAINMWYEYSETGSVSPVSQSYSSNIVSGRTPVSIGFDDRAYDEGARVIESIAYEMGGRNIFIEFLNHLYSGYTFAPFNTFQLADYIYDYSGIDFKERIIKWLYRGTRIYYSASGTKVDPRHRVDMTPPHRIIKKYSD